MSLDGDPFYQFDDEEMGEFDEFDDEDECGFPRDCGMLRDGQCTKAGSEECDWECGLLS